MHMVDGSELRFRAAEFPATAAAASAMLEHRDAPSASAPDIWRHVARARRRGRRAQTASLCLRARRPLRALLAAASTTRFGASVTPQSFELSRHDGADTLAAGHRELEDGERLFTLFGADARPEHLRGRVVLDLGCGYGGRTLYYARECGARRVEGVEITQAVVDRCTALAARLGCHNAGFRVGIAEELPFENERFDAVVSFDVLEHVDDPVRAVEEVRRVLRPGGRAWLVFPTYLGARSSHLDYVTRLPALHRVFDPDTIVEVVNEFLRADPARFGVGPQPPPQVTVLGRRTLPTLNGLTYAETGPLMRHAGLHVDKEVLTPIVTPSLPVPGARVIGSALAAYSRHARLPELLIGSIAILARRD